MSISNLETQFTVQVQSDQVTKKQREEALKLLVEYLKRIDKANKTHLMNLSNTQEILKALAKYFQEFDKNKDWMKAVGKSATSTAMKSATSYLIIKAAKEVLAKMLGEGAFAASASSKLLPGKGYNR
jgi:tRNA-dihydrouridine synthase